MQLEPVIETLADQAVKHELRPEDWVELHADYLYNFARIRLSDEELCRDLVQETFLAALEKTKNFRGYSNERTWLTAIIKYKIIDIYRKKSSAFVSRDNYGTPGEEPEYFDTDLNNWKRAHWPAHFGIEDKDPLNNKEFTQVLQRCMGKLPPLWMSVFKLKHIDEEQTDTICAELRITPSNFWVIIHRAKVNLRSCLQKNWI